MPRIPNNLRERAIVMSTEHVARNVGSSNRTIRNLRVRFRTTEITNDLPRRGRPRVTTRGQHRLLPLLLLLTHLGFIITESRKKGSVLFNDALITLYLRLYGVRHMVKDHSNSEIGTRCRHMGYSFRLAAKVLLYAPSHRQTSTYHGLC